MGAVGKLRSGGSVRNAPDTKAHLNTHYGHALFGSPQGHAPVARSGANPRAGMTYHLGLTPSGEVVHIYSDGERIVMHKPGTPKKSGRAYQNPALAGFHPSEILPTHAPPNSTGGTLAPDPGAYTQDVAAHSLAAQQAQLVAAHAQLVAKHTAAQDAAVQAAEQAAIAQLGAH